MSQLTQDKACPGLATRGQARQGGRGGTPTLLYSTTGLPRCQDEPLALQVYKRGRWCTIGKVTFLEGQRIFAIAHDQQAGVETHLSIPEVAMDFAKRWGCLAVYFWRRVDLGVRSLSFSELQGIGYWGEGAGREWYWPIASMDLVGTWARPKWEWANEVHRVTIPEPAKAHEPHGKQLSFRALLAGVGT